MPFKWKRMSLFGAVCLWGASSFYGWVELRRAKDAGTLRRVDREADLERVPAEAIPIWETGQAEVRIYKAIASSLSREVGLTLSGAWKPLASSGGGNEARSEPRYSQIFVDLLLQELQHASLQGLSPHWSELAAKRWPAQRDEIELAAAWVDIASRRYEKAAWRLRSAQKLRAHAYAHLLEAELRAGLGQRRASFASYEEGVAAFLKESVVRMRAGTPVDIWLDNTQDLLLKLAEGYLSQSWWVEARSVLARLTTIQADHPQISRLNESLRSRQPPRQAG